MKSADLTNGVSLHDSTLERVEQENNQLILHLDTVAVAPSFLYRDFKNEFVVLDHVQVICENAHTHRLEFWLDTESPTKHPEPELPVNEIMRSNLEDGILEICGFGPSSGWVTWNIRAQRFRLQWSGETRRDNP